MPLTNPKTLTDRSLVPMTLGERKSITFYMNESYNGGADGGLYDGLMSIDEMKIGARGKGTLYCRG